MTTSPHRGPMGNHSVLLVDDDPFALEVFRAAVRDLPCHVFYAASGEEALRILETQRMDLVVADHYLDGITGLALLGYINEKGNPARRVLMSGHLSVDMVTKAVNRAEVFRVLGKPLDVLTVRDVVAQALGLPPDTTRMP